MHCLVISLTSFTYHYVFKICLCCSTDETNYFSEQPLIGKENWDLEDTFARPCLLQQQSQDMEATKCLSMDLWLMKTWYRYTMEYYSAPKKEEYPAFCDNLDEIVRHIVRHK